MVMDGLTRVLPEQTLRIAILVMASDEGPVLCPFFGKCDGFLVLDPLAPAAEFHCNKHRTADDLCDRIVRSGANAVVCGFIGKAEKRRLLAADIDVRLGSCTCSVDELVAGFANLPPA